MRRVICILRICRNLDFYFENICYSVPNILGDGPWLRKRSLKKSGIEDIIKRRLK